MEHIRENILDSNPINEEKCKEAPENEEKNKSQAIQNATTVVNRPTLNLNARYNPGYTPGFKTGQNLPNANRRARIIVRNLSFKTTEKKLKAHFAKYGTVTEVKVLKRPDGKLVGCGFVQFEVVQNAAKAIYHLTGKPFLGRDIVCDWALGKSTYVKNMKEALQAEVKTEVISDDEADEKKDIIKIENPDKIDSASSEEEKNSDSEESDEESEISEEDDDEDVVEPQAKRPRVASNDVQEGKTVFIKNVPFTATNEDVKNCMSQFGPLHYALVCIDPVTEHSKGSAFVKFVNQEDAEKCLAAGTELQLRGTILDCHRAVSKNDLGNKQTKKEEKKDSRNLYLIKEGVILAGTKAAEGVSASDMARRLELEKWKTQMLRNLNMFISRQRLIIHNLPPSYDDKKLHELFAKYSGPNAVIKEARVMRNKKNLDDKGHEVSKEYGFVSYANHEDALTALRAINNNPNIFSKAKRPIVAFSIENKTAINARNKRLLKSKLNNPNNKEFKSKEKIINNKNGRKENKKKFNGHKEQNSENGPGESRFTGVTAKPGIGKMRSRYKLKTQAQLHHENLKKEKKKQKLVKKSLEQRKEDFIRQPKQKQSKGKKNNSDDNFSKLVNKYKSNLVSSNTKVKKNKWYET